jgi:glycosyltransferase involved in cell wall biosynthesis
LRVAKVIQSFPPVLGGAQRQAEALAPLLAARGADVTVITRRWTPDVAIRERRPGLRLVRVPGAGAGAAGSARWVAGAAGALLALRPDVIHAHDLLSPTTASLAAGRPLRAPVVVKVLSTGAGGDVDRLLSKPLGARRLAAAVRGVAAFVSLSADVDAELLEHGVPPERLHRIPNGVDLARFRPPAADERERERRRLGLPDAGPLTLYCGRLDPVKRLDVLLEAFAGVPGHLLIAGGGAEAERLRAAAAAPALRGRVTIIPAVDDPAPLYRAADVYASASQTEGMSNSLLEAMATGLAAAASPASGMGELLEGGAGAVAADASPAALRASLSRLADDEELRRALGARARQTVERRYSLAATADALSALYARVRAAGPPAHRA